MQLRNYALVTAGYWAFTITDGALRLLVLLHFHDLGYSPVSLAFLFLLYEFMGIVTNLLGGWVGPVFGDGAETGADGVCVDASRKVVTSCAYMFAGAPHEIYESVGRMVEETLGLC